VARALEQDQVRDTFTLKERLLLSAFAGQTWHGSTEDLNALFASDKISALAVAPLLEPALAPLEASSDALVIQLGTALAELALGADETSFSSPASARLRAALTALEQRGQYPHLCAAVRIDLQMHEGDLLAAITPLHELSRASGSPMADLIGAALHAPADPNQARRIYRALLDSEEEEVQLAAWRGALSLMDAPDDLPSSFRLPLSLPNWSWRLGCRTDRQKWSAWWTCYRCTAQR
jgi:hypothetical protein